MKTNCCNSVGSLLGHCLKGAAAGVLVLFCVWAAGATETYAAVYYVDGAHGDNQKDGKSLENAWRTLSKANSTVTAGDTVLIAAGTYAQTISPDNSGSAQAPIVYRNYNGQQVVVGTNNLARSVNLQNKSYVTLIGLTLTEAAYYVWLESSHHIMILDCVMDHLLVRPGWPVGVRILGDSHHNTIRGCTIGRAGFCEDKDDKGGVLVIGNWQKTETHCDYNLFENNVVFWGGHHLMELVGRYNVIRNNFFHNEEWMDCDRPEIGNKCGNRAIVVGYDPDQCRRNLFEGNRFAFSGVPPDQNTSSGLSIRTPFNIVRNNVFYYNDGPGLAFSTSSSTPATPNASDNKAYNNTFYHNGFAAMPGVEQWKQCGLQLAKHGTASPAEDIAIKNNLFHDNNGEAMVFYYVNREDQELAGNWEQAGDPLFRDIQSTVNPASPDLPDLRLKQGSPCIDKGAFLTTLQADAAGTRLTVADAGYFTDGWGLMDGDMIQLEGSSQPVRIVQVDYVNNTVTVDRILNGTKGQGVSLAYHGTSPDMGAHEFGEPANKPHMPASFNIIKID